jgi:hypothetical protein
MIHGIQSTQVDEVWADVEHYINRSLKYGLGEYEAEDIKELCKARQMQLWIMFDGKVKGAIVTQILKYPQFSILLGLLISADNFIEWRDKVDETLIGFGKDKDCKYLEFFGRKGWGNYLKDINYKEQVRMFSKEIV